MATRIQDAAAECPVDYRPVDCLPTATDDCLSTATVDPRLPTGDRVS